jgi:O-antigen ligase
MNSQYFKFSIKFLSYLVYLLPILLVTGPFLPDLLISVCSIFFIILCIVRNEWKYFNNIFFKIFFIFYIYLLLRSFVYSFDLLEVKSQICYIRFGILCILIYFLSDQNKNFSKNFTRIIFFLLIFLIIDGLVQYYFDYNIIGIKKYSLDRISGVFGKHAKLGSYIARLFPLSLLYLLPYITKNKNFFNFCYLFFSCLVFIGVLITGERTALFLFLFASLLFSLFNKIILKKFLILLIFLTSIFLLFNIYDVKLNNRIVLQTKSQLSSAGKLNFFSKEHESHYLISYRMFKDNVFFGQGPNSFRLKCSNVNFRLENNYGCTTHPHNIYIQSLAEIGIIGFLFLITCFLIIYYKIIKNILNNFKKKIILSNLHFYILTIAISLSLFPFSPTGNLFNNWMSIIFYLPVGFLLNQYSKIK